MEASPDAVQTEYPAGWYDFNGGKRYWDGGAWTHHFAYVPPPVAPERISYIGIALAVAIGMVAGWFVIWLGAQEAPDTFYWPVKFVVEDLPNFNP
jgi:hypothetical protein